MAGACFLLRHPQVAECQNAFPQLLSVSKAGVGKTDGLLLPALALFCAPQSSKNPTTARGGYRGLLASRRVGTAAPWAPASTLPCGQTVAHPPRFTSVGSTAGGGPPLPARRSAAPTAIPGAIALRNAWRRAATRAGSGLRGRMRPRRCPLCRYAHLIHALTLTTLPPCGSCCRFRSKPARTRGSAVGRRHGC